MDDRFEQLTTWLEESKDILLRTKKHRILNHQTTKAQIEELKRQKKKWDELASNVEFTEEQKAEIKNLKDSIKKLNVITEEKTRLVNEQKENHQLNENFVKTKTNDVHSKESEVSTKSEKLDKGLRYFDKYLGLKVIRFQDTHLKFQFTCINEENPDKEYSFDLTVEGTPGVYKVTNCSENIQDLRGHINELNETNNLRKFLCKMRNSFKGL